MGSQVPQFLHGRLELVDALQAPVHVAGELHPVRGAESATCRQVLPILPDTIAKQEAIDAMGLNDLCRQVAEVLADRTLHSFF
jgi:hypothetical protein